MSTIIQAGDTPTIPPAIPNIPSKAGGAVTEPVSAAGELRRLVESGTMEPLPDARTRVLH